jgi:tetratricopeptide (TPR) repeat protein
MGGIEALRVGGSLGQGKTRAVWEVLAKRGGRVVWLTARPSRHRGPGLAEQALHRLVAAGRPGRRELAALGVSDPDELLVPGETAPSADLREMLLDKLPSWLADGSDGPRATLVCDDLESATAGDLELVAELAGAAVGGAGFRVVLIARPGAFDAGPRSLRELPEVRVPAMEPDEMESFRRAACRGLSLAEEVAERFRTEAAGNPFAFEEGLTALAERDLIRQIHGNLFFRGGPDAGYTPSNRLTQHVEAEVLRLGDPAPLRLLALAGEPVPDGCLRSAARAGGVATDRGWLSPFLESGMVGEAEGPWGPGVGLACPAFGSALRSEVTGESAESLRRLLGEALADETHTGSWRTYGLLQGTEDAVDPLLAAAREQGAPPAELVAALETELARHRAAGVKPETELELLWALMPLRHRLEGLGGARADLERALELAADNPKKWLALAGLQAELDEDEGRLAEAETALRRALDESRRSRGKPVQALLLLRLARLLVRRERFAEARELLDRVLPILEEAGATALAASARFHLANIALHENRLEEALELHGKALEARRRLDRSKPVGMSLSALGTVALQMGRYTEALSCYQEAEQAFSAAGEEDQAAFALIGLGRAHSRLGDFLSATRPLRRALAIRERRGDRVGEALARLEAAENTLLLGRPGDALAEARRCHFDLTLSSAHGPVAAAEQLLGRIFWVQRAPAEARRHLESALEAHRAADDPEALAFDLSWLLLVELQQGDPGEVSRRVAELESAIGRCPSAERGDRLAFRLYRGLAALGRESEARPWLTRGYRGLLTKTEHLPPELRHRFLFQIREHEEMVRAATEAGLAEDRGSRPPAVNRLPGSA